MAANNQISVIPGTTGNYILSFEIVPTGTVDNWSNILRFTNGRHCCDFGNRSPSFFLYPGSVQLQVIIGDFVYGNWPADSQITLSFKTRTKVMLECNGPDVKLYVGESGYYATQPTRRFSGDLTVYASDPWDLAANAEIYNLSYKILPADGKTSIHTSTMD